MSGGAQATAILRNVLQGVLVVEQRSLRRGGSEHLADWGGNAGERAALGWRWCQTQRRA
jgi:hypothetical protein